MHELGVVFHVIDMVTGVAKENNVSAVKSVTLEIGQVSGVIHSYLEDCWKWAVNRTEVMKGCELIIEEIPALTWCEDCETTYDTVKYAKICPNCGSEHTYLKQGNEFSVKEICVYDPADDGDGENSSESTEDDTGSGMGDG